MNMLKSLIIALAMYSKLPVPNIDWDEKNMRYAMCFFPVVGVIIGALVFGAGQLILRYTECGKLFFAAVMTMIPVAVTGGIHLDGFADTIDAVSSYKDREKKLEILKDPHTGAFAVIGLCAYFLITAALWSEVNLKTLSLAVWMYPISRALSGLSVVSFRSAKSSGLLFLTVSVICFLRIVRANRRRQKYWMNLDYRRCLTAGCLSEKEAERSP